MRGANAIITDYVIQARPSLAKPGEAKRRLSLLINTLSAVEAEFKVVCAAAIDTAADTDTDNTYGVGAAADGGGDRRGGVNVDAKQQQHSNVVDGNV